MTVNGNKVREGKGKMTDGNEIYIGDWKNDEMHGEGMNDLFISIV